MGGTLFSFGWPHCMYLVANGPPPLLGGMEVAEAPLLFCARRRVTDGSPLFPCARARGRASPFIRSNFFSAEHPFAALEKAPFPGLDLFSKDSSVFDIPRRVEYIFLLQGKVFFRRRPFFLPKTAVDGPPTPPSVVRTSFSPPDPSM